MDVEEFKEYDWNGRREVVIVGDTQVETFEDFLHATERSQDDTPYTLGRAIFAHSCLWYAHPATTSPGTSDAGGAGDPARSGNV